LACPLNKRIPIHVFGKNAASVLQYSRSCAVCTVFLMDNVAHGVSLLHFFCRYFLNIFLDTTFGVGVLYLFLKAADFYFGRMRIDGMRTGDYGNPPQLIRWWRQTLVFSLGLVVMKIVVVIVLTWVRHLFFLASLSQSLWVG